MCHQPPPFQASTKEYSVCSLVPRPPFGLLLCNQTKQGPGNDATVFLGKDSCSILLPSKAQLSTIKSACGLILVGDWDWSACGLVCMWTDSSWELVCMWTDTSWGLVCMWTDTSWGLGLVCMWTDTTCSWGDWSACGLILAGGTGPEVLKAFIYVRSVAQGMQRVLHIPHVPFWDSVTT